MSSRGFSAAVWPLLGALLMASVAADELEPGMVSAQVAGLESPPLFIHVAGPPLDQRPTYPPFTPKAPPSQPMPLPPPKQRIFPPMDDIPLVPVAGNADPKTIPKDDSPSLSSGAGYDLTYGGLPVAGNADPKSDPQSGSGYSIEMGVKETPGEDTAMTVVVCMVGLAATVLVFVGYKSRQRQTGQLRSESEPLVVLKNGSPVYGSAVIAGSAV